MTGHFVCLSNTGAAAVWLAGSSSVCFGVGFPHPLVIKHDAALITIAVMALIFIVVQLLFII